MYFPLPQQNDVESMNSIGIPACIKVIMLTKHLLPLVALATLLV